MASTDTLYEQAGFRGRIGFGDRPAIVIVDLQKGFTDPESPLGSSMDAVVAACRELLDRGRAKGVPTFFTVVEYEPGMKDAGLWRRKIPSIRTLQAGSDWVALDPRLERRDGEIVVTKKYASAFFGTPLSATLTAHRVDTVIIGGCTTGGCVRATAIDALQNGFRPIVARECVGDRTAEIHTWNLDEMDARYVDVEPLDSVLSHLEAL